MVRSLCGVCGFKPGCSYGLWGTTQHHSAFRRVVAGCSQVSPSGSTFNVIIKSGTGEAKPVVPLIAQSMTIADGSHPEKRLEFVFDGQDPQRIRSLTGIIKAKDISVLQVLQAWLDKAKSEAVTMRQEFGLGGSHARHGKRPVHAPASRVHRAGSPPELPDAGPADAAPSGAPVSSISFSRLGLHPGGVVKNIVPGEALHQVRSAQVSRQLLSTPSNPKLPSPAVPVPSAQGPRAGPSTAAATRSSSWTHAAGWFKAPTRWEGDSFATAAAASSGTTPVVTFSRASPRRRRRSRTQEAQSTTDAWDATEETLLKSLLGALGPLPPGLPPLSQHADDMTESQALSPLSMWPLHSPGADQPTDAVSAIGSVHSLPPTAPKLHPESRRAKQARRLLEQGIQGRAPSARPEEWRGEEEGAAAVVDLISSDGSDDDDDDDDEPDAALADASSASSSSSASSAAVSRKDSSAMGREASVAAAPDGLVAETGALTLRAGDVARFQPTGWLSDVNVEFALRLTWRLQLPPLARARAHICSTFLFSSLSAHASPEPTEAELQAGYEAVSRWCKDVDVFAKSLLLVPVHRAGHWSLIAVLNPSAAARRFRAMSAVTAAPEAAIADLEAVSVERGMSGPTAVAMAEKAGKRIHAEVAGDRTSMQPPLQPLAPLQFCRVGLNSSLPEWEVFGEDAFDSHQRTGRGPLAGRQWSGWDVPPNEAAFRPFADARPAGPEPAVDPSVARSRSQKEESRNAAAGVISSCMLMQMLGCLELAPDVERRLGWPEEGRGLSECVLLHCDSLGSHNSRWCCAIVRFWLVREWERRRGRGRELVRGAGVARPQATMHPAPAPTASRLWMSGLAVDGRPVLPHVRLQVPQQDNSCDCGVFTARFGRCMLLVLSRWASEAKHTTMLSTVAGTQSVKLPLEFATPLPAIFPPGHVPQCWPLTQRLQFPVMSTRAVRLDLLQHMLKAICGSPQQQQQLSALWAGHPAPLWHGGPSGEAAIASVCQPLTLARGATAVPTQVPPAFASVKGVPAATVRRAAVRMRNTPAGSGGEAPSKRSSVAPEACAVHVIDDDTDDVSDDEAMAVEQPSDDDDSDTVQIAAHRLKSADRGSASNQRLESMPRVGKRSSPNARHAGTAQGTEGGQATGESGTLPEHKPLAWTAILNAAGISGEHMQSTASSSNNEGDNLDDEESAALADVAATNRKGSGATRTHPMEDSD